MELGGGGESAARSASLSSDDAAAAAAATSEDRLSALPNDILVLILLKLHSTGAAVRTSLLSHRWRRIWAFLPVLYFTSPIEPHRLRDALDAHEMLVRKLLVGAKGENADAESLAVWLPAAARRVCGELILCCSRLATDEEEEQAAQRGAFELPCFDKATWILLALDFQGLAVPPTGVFTRLTKLLLVCVWFHGPGDLGGAISSPRCPCLQELIIVDCRGLCDLTINSVSLLRMELNNVHSLSQLTLRCPCLQRLTVEACRGLCDLTIRLDSLLLMELRDLHSLSQLTVVAPALKELNVASCFRKRQPVANISAPQLVDLDWNDVYDPSSVHLGKMEHLRSLGTGYYLVHGPEIWINNQSCLSLMQRFEDINTLSLRLMYPPDLEDYEFLMEDMIVLPNITVLWLRVIANGHAFGASAFHVLRLCIGIRKLILELPTTTPSGSEVQTVCSSDCICDQPADWETEELLLNHLEEVEISGLTGFEHEFAFVKRLFSWGTKLKEMTVTFCHSTSEIQAKELYQIYQSFSRPEVCLKLYLYRNLRRVLYAPED